MPLFKSQKMEVPIIDILSYFPESSIKKMIDDLVNHMEDNIDVESLSSQNVGIGKLIKGIDMIDRTVKDVWVECWIIYGGTWGDIPMIEVEMRYIFAYDPLFGVPFKVLERYDKIKKSIK